MRKEKYHIDVLLGVFALNAFFVVLFAASAWLFRRSAPGRDRDTTTDRG